MMQLIIPGRLGVRTDAGGHAMISLKDWKAGFLKTRELQIANSEPLFTYRVSGEEFQALEECLRYWLGKWLKMLPFDDLAEKLVDFPGLFVLYAAEWWKRRYDGTGWSWEPILDALGVDAEQWTQQQRSSCVVQGLKQWGLQPQDRRGLRYLGSIAFNGGLPLRLLAESRGNIGQLLSQILKLAKTGSSPQANLVGWIESQNTELPRAYRKREIYVLLAEVISTVIGIQQDHQLHAGENVVAVLDQKDPHWRNRFPLPVEDEHARGLIEQLIRDVVSVPTARSSGSLSVERFLESSDGGFWQLRSDVLVPERIDLSALQQLFNLDGPAIPSLATLYWQAGTVSELLGLRKLAGHDRFSMGRRPLTTLDLCAMTEQTIELLTATGSIARTSLPRGAALDEDLPWVFAVDGSSARFIRQGSGAISTVQALVSVSESWQTQADAEACCEHAGWMLQPERSVYRITGRVRFLSPDGESFAVRTQKLDAQDDLLEWSGQRVWQVFDTPVLAFRGQPNLFRRKPGGEPLSNHAEKVSWTVWGGALGATFLVGPIEARWLQQGETRWRSRMVILSPDARETLVPGDSPQKGSIKLHHWGVSSIVCLTPGLDISIELAADVVCIRLAVSDPHAQIPERVQMQIRWPHTTQTAQISLPFPAVGAVVFDAASLALQSKTVLLPSQMTGSRLCLNFGNQQQARLIFELTQVSLEQRISVPSVDIRSTAGHHQVELRLMDYRSLVEELFGSVDSPDTQVRLTVTLGTFSYRLFFSRHAGELQCDEHLGFVGLDEEQRRTTTLELFDTATLHALKLDEPELEPICLNPVRSQGVALGDWHFSPESRAPGPWLIYPAADCSLNFRPQLWPVAGPIQHDSMGIREALSTEDVTLRLHRLDQAIEQLVADFTSPDWVTVEQLVAHLQHLPLATLDLWRRFARSGLGMAALSLRMSAVVTPAFVSRFATELPFMWELVAYEDWLTAMQGVEQQAEAWYGEAGRTPLNDHLNQQREYWASHSPAICFLLDASYSAVMQKATRETKMARHPQTDLIAKQTLFEAENSLLQLLLREHADHEWPDTLSSRFSPTCEEQGAKKFLCGQFNSDDKNSTVNLPILLAYQAATNKTSNWLANIDDIRHLRSYRAFDPQWFAEAYHWTLARCLSTGTLTW